MADQEPTLETTLEPIQHKLPEDGSKPSHEELALSEARTNQVDENVSTLRLMTLKELKEMKKLLQPEQVALIEEFKYAAELTERAISKETGVTMGSLQKLFDDTNSVLAEHGYALEREQKEERGSSTWKAVSTKIEVLPSDQDVPEDLVRMHAEVFELMEGIRSEVHQALISQIAGRLGGLSEEAALAQILEITGEDLESKQLERLIGRLNTKSLAEKGLKLHLRNEVLILGTTEEIKLISKEVRLSIPVPFAEKPEGEPDDNATSAMPTPSPEEGAQPLFDKLEALQQEIELLSKKLAELRKANKASNVAKGAAEKTLTNANARIRSYTRELEVLQMENGVLKRQIKLAEKSTPQEPEEPSKEILLLSRRIEKLDAQIVALKEKNQQLQRTKSDLEIEVTTMGKKIAVLTGKLGKVQQETADMAEDNEGSASEDSEDPTLVKDLETSLEEMSAELAASEKALAAKIQELRNLRRDTTTTVRRLEQQLEAKEREVSGLKRQPTLTEQKTAEKGTEEEGFSEDEDDNDVELRELTEALRSELSEAQNEVAVLNEHLEGSNNALRTHLLTRIDRTRLKEELESPTPHTLLVPKTPITKIPQLIAIVSRIFELKLTAKGGITLEMAQTVARNLTALKVEAQTPDSLKPAIDKLIVNISGIVKDAQSTHMLNGLSELPFAHAKRLLSPAF